MVWRCVRFGGAGRAYKPVTHGAASMSSARASATRVVIERDDVELWRGVLFFFERGLAVRVIV